MLYGSPALAQDDTEDDDGADDDGDTSSDKDTGRGKRKRAVRRKKGDGVVKSNSNAALAMLAGAAATKPGAPGNPAAAAAAAAAMQQNLGELWGTLNGGAAAGLPAGIDMSKLSPEQQQQFMSGNFEVRRSRSPVRLNSMRAPGLETGRAGPASQPTSPAAERGLQAAAAAGAPLQLPLLQTLALPFSLPPPPPPNLHRRGCWMSVR
jgi:hypothetical protein